MGLWLKTIRDFVRRLSTLDAAAKHKPALALRSRRIVVPEAARFSLDGTLIRTLPIEPAMLFDCPGGPLELAQLLIWLDLTDANEGSAFGDNDLGVDLAAVLALATGRRVAFANEVPTKYELSPQTTFLSINHMFDGELHGPVEIDTRDRFGRIVRALAALPERRALDLGGAIRMRNAACCLVQADHSSAYGLLVVALETLSRAFGNPSSSWGDWEQAADWDGSMLNLGLSGNQAQRIREKLMDNKQIRLKRTFVDYIFNGLSQSFWEQRYFNYTPTIAMDANDARHAGGSWEDAGPVAQFVPTDHGELRRRLGKSYDARSEVFHQSVRLEQVALLPVPGVTKQPLPFAGLRRILDHLLWQEIEISARDAPALPDFQVVYPADEPNGTD